MSAASCSLELEAPFSISVIGISESVALFLYKFQILEGLALIDSSVRSTNSRYNFYDKYL